MRWLVGAALLSAGVLVEGQREFFGNLQQKNDDVSQEVGRPRVQDEYALRLGVDSVHVGFRFDDFTVPANSEIAEAYLIFKSSKSASGNPPRMSIYLESTNFYPDNFDDVGGVVEWPALPDTSENNYFDSVDFSGALQDVVNRDDYNEASTLMIILKTIDAGLERDIYSKNSDDDAPTLFVSYFDPADDDDDDTLSPTLSPSSESPTRSPTSSPSTRSPTLSPTTLSPTSAPTRPATAGPFPTEEPTAGPNPTDQPTSQPTTDTNPTQEPTGTPKPTDSGSPTAAPTPPSRNITSVPPSGNGTSDDDNMTTMIVGASAGFLLFAGVSIVAVRSRGKQTNNVLPGSLEIVSKSPRGGSGGPTDALDSSDDSFGPFGTELSGQNHSVNGDVAIGIPLAVVAGSRKPARSNVTEEPSGSQLDAILAGSTWRKSSTKSRKKESQTRSIRRTQDTLQRARESPSRSSEDAAFHVTLLSSTPPNI